MDAVWGSASHLRATVARCRDLATRSGVAGMVLTTPGAVAWATGGMNQPIDRTASTDVVWLAVGPDRACLVTTNVEAPRLTAEYAPDEHGLELVAVPWWDGEAMARAAAGALGQPTARLGSDGHPAFGRDLSVELVKARLVLDPWEQERLRALGQDAAFAVQEALREWVPGEPDRAVAARIAASMEAVGAQAPVLLVGGDDRMRNFRHPVATGAPLRGTVMAVLVAARFGQHVALTRYASSKRVEPEFAAGMAAARRIHRRTLAASRPGAVVGDIVAELAAAYAQENHEGAWQQHYQGGPIGYAQREFELAPGQQSSPWWNTPLAVGCAVAWNPSLPGGPKDEDTYLVRERGPEPITVTTDWPMADDQLPARPALLITGS